MKTVNHVNEVLEDFFKLFYKTEDLALKVGIKGLTHTELHIIEAIGTGSLTMHELSEKLGTTMGTVTVAATKLAEKNFILRNRSESDRRKVYVSLDKKGIEAVRVAVFIKNFRRSMFVVLSWWYFLLVLILFVTALISSQTDVVAYIVA